MKLHKISKEGHEKCEIEIIDDKDYFWINRRDLEIESDYKNWAVIFDKCDPKEQKYRCKFILNTKLQPCKVLVRNDLVERKSQNIAKKALEFKEKLGLYPNKHSCDEQDIVRALQVALEGEVIHTQYCVHSKRLYFQFPKPKLGIEIENMVMQAEILEINKVGN